MSLALTELAERIDPNVRGWMQYYGTFYRSALDALIRRLNAYLLPFLRRKYRRLRRFTKAWRLSGSDYRRAAEPVRPLAMADRVLTGDRDSKSPATGDFHVTEFVEAGGIPPATRRSVMEGLTCCNGTTRPEPGSAFTVHTFTDDRGAYPP